MKKLTSVLLVLIMVLAMGASAFAGEAPDLETNESAVIPVKIEFVDGEKTTTIYNVDVTWEDLTFTFTNGDEKLWNPENHTYSEPEADGWSEAKKITVNNHSNAAVKVKTTFDESQDVVYTSGGVTMEITCNMAVSENTVVLANAAEQAPGAPAGNPGVTLVTYTITPSGEASADVDAFAYVRVQISAA